jgi:hypothetical protein
MAPEKYQRQRKSAAELSADLPKNGRKGAELLKVCFSLKILRLFAELDPKVS